MAAEASSLDTIFCAAVEIVSADDRAAYLAQACGDDRELFARVIKLVNAHFRAGQFLERPVRRLGATDAFTPGSGDTAIAVPREGPGTQIGPYKLLQSIGEGGMGSVWMAEQQQPVQRTVALKLIKAGMDSAQIIARFEAERQALALMDHPNIARVLDAGTVGPVCRTGPDGVPGEGEGPARQAGPTGRPYFVMELVKGVPITRHCDEHRLGPEQRLELFVSVCHAVQHAHQKGIIHRDIKPSNVLVASFDGKPVPKVIDFGIAKATGPRLTERTLFTEFGAVVGTLEYMSPEQAELNQLDIDTRSDIYSLGVLLYELLTGSTPLERKHLKEKGLLEVLRLIREEEPPTPSTRLRKDEGGRMKDEKKLPARFFSSFILHPSSLQELDWIVMKCLEKDRNRRYETANGLALDLQRYLRDEPVQAGPPSRSYRVRKFLKRHRGPVLAAAVVVLALLGGMVGTSVGMVQAESARQEAVVAEGKERDQRQLAEQEMRISQAVRVFLQVKLLGQADTRVQADSLLGAGRLLVEAKENPTIRELLDRAARELTPDRIETQFPDEPLVQAEILQTIGNTYRGIGEYGPAIAHLKRAHDLRQQYLGPDHRDTLTVLNNLALAYRAAVELRQATRLFEQLRDRVVAKLGPDDPLTLAVMNGLALTYRAAGMLPEAIRLHEQVRDKQMQTVGPGHRETLSTLNNLALTYRSAGKLKEAVRLLEQVRDSQVDKIGPDHPDTLAMLGNLALSYQSVGKLTEAIRLQEQVRDIQIQKLGLDHPNTLNTLHHLAGSYRAAGRFPQAMRLLEQVSDRRVAKLGPDDPFTLTALSDLGLAYQDAGNLKEAIRLHEKARDGLTVKLGADHTETLSVLNNLALAYRSAGKMQEAISLFEKVRDGLTAQLGSDHPLILAALHNLALTFQGAGKMQEAISLFEKVCDQFTAKLGPDHPNTLAALDSLAGAYRTAGKLPKAIRLWQQVRDGAVAKFGPDHPFTLRVLGGLAAAFWSTKQLDRSVPLFEQVLKGEKKQLGPDHPDTLLTMMNLAVNYRDAGRLPEALPLLEDALARSSKLPEPVPADLNWIPIVLATFYDQDGLFAKSEPFHRASLERSRRQSGADDVRTAGAMAELGLNLLRQKKYAEAAQLLRECLAIREQREKDAWTTSNAKSLLGGALLGQKKYADAEPLLLTGYKGMKQREEEIPDRFRNTRLGEALERLVRLYEAWDKKDEAARWREKWKALKPPPVPPAARSAPPRSRP